jgi:hypothetical protein
MKPDISSLMSNISFWETWGYVALAAVLVGVAGESIKEFTKWLDQIGWEKRISRLSALILVAGLAGEGITQPNTNAANAILIAYLNNQATQALSEQERLKQAMSWRRLTKEQHDKLLAAFKDSRITLQLSEVMNDPEAVQYWTDIFDTLDKANMKNLGVFRGYQTVVGLFLLPSFDNHDSADLDFVASTFASVGIPLTKVPRDPNESRRISIEVIIGGKPPPF